MSDLSKIKSSYSNLLPSIFRGAEEESTIFFERFLKIFEDILTGINDDEKIDDKKTTGIAETIDTIHNFFYPSTVPNEFLDWLSSWVGLVLKEDWSEEKKREVIRNVIPIYRMRGTKRGLEEYLNIYVGKGVSINDNFGLFQVGVNPHVAINTAIDLINYFVVEVTLSEA